MTNDIVFGLIPIGFVRFSIRMGWKWVGIDGKGYANTTYISEFHSHVPADRQPVFFEKTGRPAGRRISGIRYQVSGIRYVSGDRY